MAGAIGMMNGASGSWMQFRNVAKKRGNYGNKGKFRVSCVYSPSMTDPYKTLRIQPGASESEVKKAFRKLALQYHPDVCKGNNSGIRFHEINEAYDAVMNRLRGQSQETEMYDQYCNDAGGDEAMTGYESDFELWEEWMGWEGAGIRDYTSHINPYI
ncbi:hypothetical protein Leryth_003028 [Lithospermum erythrorhizon]|uniref:Chaperone n=1 Tax=Lithospermum erythrorhizon TaxID=34254 RepID=A0AAV3P6R3_LITER|nr:hypothetical protein Leryth_003028 [Lithospermum erythrorhizon]